jgi:hypothetical protein
MIIDREIIVNANIESAWKVLGTQFADASRWATVVNHSEGSGESFNGASCSERGCSVKGMGNIKEKILQFSNDNHSLTYQIVEGMPGMVKYATNSWKLTSLGQDRSKLEMQMNVEVSGFMGWMMQPMMKMQMGNMGTGITEDFKYYVENGKPSPKKIKAVNKYNS